MADELTIGAFRLSYAKGTAAPPALVKAEQTIDVSGVQFEVARVQSIGFAAEEAIALGDIVVGGWWYLENLDATNYVAIRPASGETDMLELRPGEGFPFRQSRASTAPFALANTGAVDLLIARWEP